MTKKEAIFQDIYDLIKGGEFEEEAKKNIRRYTKAKHIEWDNDNHTIKLGSHFIIRLETI